MIHGVSPESACTDARILTGTAYYDGRNLAARQQLYTWKEPQHDVPGMALEQIRDIDGPIIDVGCGNGTILQAAHKEIPRLRIVGLDLSPGIIKGLEGPLLVGNAMRMPFADGAASAIMAMHMIFHLPDVASGLRELMRVLSKDGTLIVSTNGRRDKIELHQIWSRASSNLGPAKKAPRISVSDRFPLDDAPGILSQYFTEVRLLHLDGVATITDSAPAMAYLGSRRAWATIPGLSFDGKYSVIPWSAGKLVQVSGRVGCMIPRVDRILTFDDTLKHAQKLISGIIDRDGYFNITCRSGILICRGMR